MGHLKGCLIEFLRATSRWMTCRCASAPAIPFTEPSAEVDIGCTRSGGTLRIGHGQDGWRSSAAAWSTRRCSKTAASTRSLARLRFRHGAGADRHAEVWHSRPAHLLRLRPAMAAPLRLRGPRSAVARGGSVMRSRAPHPDPLPREREAPSAGEGGPAKILAVLAEAASQTPRRPRSPRS